MPEETKPMQIDKQSNLVIAKYSGTALKRISFNRFEGHAIRWHDPYRDPDATGNPFDLSGEWFSAKTNRMLKMGYPIVGAPVNYQHGMHKDFGATGIGLLDYTEEDEIGQLVKGELYEREQYLEMLRDIGRLKGYQVSDSQYNKRAEMAFKAVQTLVNEVPLQFSGGFDPSTWIVDPDSRHIDQAGLIHLAFTPTPADDLNPIVAFKSAFSEAFKLEHERKTFDMSIPVNPARESATNGETIGQETTVTLTASPNSQAVVTISNLKTIPNKGQNKMEEFYKELVALLAKYGMTMGMEETVAATSAEEISEELRAELPEEEMKQLPEEEMQKRMASVSEKAISKLKARFDKWQKSNEAMKSALEKQFAAMQKDALPPVEAFSNAKTKGNAKTPQISVGELQKYAHLSGHDMALGVKLALATADPWQKRGLTIGGLVEKGIFTEEYLKIMAHKMVSDVDDWKPRDGMGKGDLMAVKSAYPFKANDINATDITGFGLEWVELQYDAQLWERARDSTELFNLMAARGMEVKTVPQGRNGLNIKLNTSSGSVYTMPESNDLDATGKPETVARITQFGTSEVEQPLATHVLAHSITMQLEEDSIINVLSWLPGEMQTTLAESLESAIINGDETTTINSNINLIDGTPATGTQTPLYIAWDGLRHDFIIDNAAAGYDRDGNGIIALTDFEETLALFPSSIKNRRKSMLYVIDEKTESAVRRFPELLTFGVAGQQATVYSGMLPPLFGVDAYMSGFLELSDTTGKISATPSNNTHGTLIAVYCPYWVYGRKREVTIEQGRDIYSQTTGFVATVRHLFKSRGAGATAGTFNAGTYA